MKNIKNKILIIVSILILSIFYLYPYFDKDKVILAPEATEGLPKEERKIDNTIRKEEATQKTPDLVKNQIEEIKVSLVVKDKTYEAGIPKDSSVYDLMNIINNDKSKNFNFDGREFSGMGYFVDSINGVRGVSGAYWIYYVNDKKAEIGVSQYILKDGDEVEWKQEGLMN